MHCLIELRKLNSGHQVSSPFPVVGIPARSIVLLLIPSVLAPQSRTQVLRVLPIELAPRPLAVIGTQAQVALRPPRNTARALFQADAPARSAGNSPPESPPLRALSSSETGPIE